MTSVLSEADATGVLEFVHAEHGAVRRAAHVVPSDGSERFSAAAVVFIREVALDR